MKKAMFSSEVTDKTKLQTALVLESVFSKEIQIILPAGQEMKEHKTAFPILVHIITGRIDFTAENKTQRYLKEILLV